MSHPHTRARHRVHVPEANGRREARRAELLDAAIAAIRRFGAGASMEQMAAEAGISKPILYRHFGDKAELYQAIAQRYVDLVGAEVRGAIGRAPATAAPADAPRRMLAAGIDAYLRLVEREPEIYRFLMQRARFEQSATAATIDNFVRRLGQEVGLLLGEQLAAGGLDTGGAEAWGHAIVGMVNAAGDWWVDRQVLSRKRLVGYLTDLLWAGFDGMPVGPPPRRRPKALAPVGGTDSTLVSDQGGTT